MIFSIESESPAVALLTVVVFLVSCSRSVHPCVLDLEWEPDVPIFVFMELHVPIIAASKTGSEAVSVPNVRSSTVQRMADVNCQHESLVMVTIVCWRSPPRTVVPPTSQMKKRRAFLAVLILTYQRMMIGARRRTIL